MIIKLGFAYPKLTRKVVKLDKTISRLYKANVNLNKQAEQHQEFMHRNFIRKIQFPAENHKANFM